MKRALVFLLALFLVGPLSADQVKSIWTAQTAPAAVAIPTDGYQTAQVTIWVVSGSPDGTVTIYSQPPGGAPLVALKTYATPTTAKTFRGPAGTGLVVALSGNTTGAVGAIAVLK